MDRLVRFTGILKVCTAAEGPSRDLERAVKVLDKLSSVREGLYCQNIVSLCSQNKYYCWSLNKPLSLRVSSILQL